MERLGIAVFGIWLCACPSTFSKQVAYLAYSLGLVCGHLHCFSTRWHPRPTFFPELSFTYLWTSGPSEASIWGWSEPSCVAKWYCPVGTHGRILPSSGNLSTPWSLPNLNHVEVLSHAEFWKFLQQPRMPICCHSCLCATCLPPLTLPSGLWCYSFWSTSVFSEVLFTVLVLLYTVIAV